MVLRPVHWLLGVVFVVGVAGGVEFYALSRGINGGCLKAFFGVAGVGAGVLMKAADSYIKEVRDARKKARQ
jgi:hypothetical protein